MPDYTLTRSRLDVVALVPPGDSLVAILPLELFRVEAIRTPTQPTFSLVRDGVRLPFDGSFRTIPRGRRTTTVGGSIVFHVHSEHDRSTPLSFSLWGSSIEGRESIEHWTQQGAFVQEATEPVTDALAPPDTAGLERLDILATVPPGRSLVGLYPTRLLAVSHVRTAPLPGLSLPLQGETIACEGQFRALPFYESRLHYGSFSTVLVNNASNARTAFACTLWGRPAVAPSPGEFFESCAGGDGELDATSLLPKGS